MRSPRSKLLHCSILVLVLLGWGQQLCAQADMLCNAEPAAVEVSESCHEAPPVPEPAPTMECCEAPDAVAATPTVLVSPDLSEPVVSLEPLATAERWTSPIERPEAPPPDLLARHCTLLL